MLRNISAKVVAAFAASLIAGPVVGQGTRLRNVVRIATDTPTVVAFCAVTPREVDRDTSGDDVAVALDDFQYSLQSDSADFHRAGPTARSSMIFSSLGGSS